MPRPVTPPCSETPSPKEDPSEVTELWTPFSHSVLVTEQRSEATQQVPSRTLTSSPWYLSDPPPYPLPPSLGKAGERAAGASRGRGGWRRGRPWEGAITALCGCRSQVTLQKPLVQKLLPRQQGNPRTAFWRLGGGGGGFVGLLGGRTLVPLPPRRKDTDVHRGCWPNTADTAVWIWAPASTRRQDSLQRSSSSTFPVLPAHRAMSSEGSQV